MPTPDLTSTTFRAGKYQTSITRFGPFYGLRCEAFQHGSRSGINIYDVGGQTLGLCWMCAAGWLACLEGYACTSP